MEGLGGWLGSHHHAGHKRGRNVISSLTYEMEQHTLGLHIDMDWTSVRPYLDMLRSLVM
jgi:hypothetical protein